MLLDGNFQDDDFTDSQDDQPPPWDEFSSRPVPGLGGLLVGTVKPAPYPINIYNIDDDSSSGIAGTLHPDGTMDVLPVESAGRARHEQLPPPTTRYWDDVCACFRTGEVVWDGIVAGSIDHSADPEQPNRRLWDASITGEWPNHPPKAEKLVNPEKARLAALEAEKDKAEWN